MKVMWIWVGMAWVLLGGCYRQRPLHPVFPMGRPTPEVLLRVWLTKSCSVGEMNDLEREMRRLGDRLTPALIAAFKGQPPQEELDKLARNQWELLGRMRQEAELTGLSRDQLNLMLERRDGIYVHLALTRYIRNWRSAALAGLEVVDTAKARAYVEKESNDDRSSFQESARVIVRARRGR